MVQLHIPTQMHRISLKLHNRGIGVSALSQDDGRNVLAAANIQISDSNQDFPDERAAIDDFLEAFATPVAFSVVSRPAKVTCSETIHTQNPSILLEELSSGKMSSLSPAENSWLTPEHYRAATTNLKHMKRGSTYREYAWKIRLKFGWIVNTFICLVLPIGGYIGSLCPVRVIWYLNAMLDVETKQLKKLCFRDT